MRPLVSICSSAAAALAVAAITAHAAGQSAPTPEGAARPVTAAGCVQRVEESRGGPAAAAQRGAPRFLLMNATVLSAGAALPAPPGATGATDAGRTGDAANTGTGRGGGDSDRFGQRREPGESGGPSGNQAARRQDVAAGIDQPQASAGAGTRPANVARQYLLASADDLSRHVGFQVEITGMLEPITTNPADTRSPGSAQTTGNPILQVKSVKGSGKPCQR